MTSTVYLYNRFLNFKFVKNNFDNIFLPFLLCLYIFALPFYAYMPRTTGLEFMSILVFLELILLIIVITKIALKQIHLVNSRQNLYLLGFCVVAAFSSIFTLKIYDALSNLWIMVHFLVMYFLIIHIVDSGKKLKWLFLALVISGFVASLFGIYQYATGIGIEPNRRIGSVSKDPNDFAAFLIPLVPICMALFETNKEKIKKGILLFFIPIILLTIILTQSRGGLIALLVVLFLLFLEQKNKTKLVLLLIIFLLLSLPFIPISFWQRASTLISGEGAPKESPGSITQRARILVSGTAMFLDNFLFGVGIGNYRYVLPRYTPIESLGGSTLRVSHNMYLQIAAELGIFGLLFFLAMIWQTFKNIKHFQIKLREKMLGTYLNISFIGLLVAGFFLTIAYYPLVWIFFAIGSLKLGDKHN